MKNNNIESPRCLHELIYLDPMSCGRIFAGMTFVILILVVIPMKVLVALRDVDVSFLYSLLILGGALIVYTLFAYVGGILFALIYNAISKRIGGIMFLS